MASQLHNLFYTPRTDLIVGYKSIPRPPLGFSLDGYTVSSYRLNADSPVVTLAMLASPVMATDEYAELHLRMTRAVISSFLQAFEHAQTFESFAILKAGFDAANDYIYKNRKAGRLIETWSPTSFSAVIIAESRLFLASAGQCRVFLVRGSDAQQINTVHSFGDYLIAGKHVVSCEELLRHPHTVMVMRAVGYDEQVKFDDYCDFVQDISLQAGDCIVMCSDLVFGECLLQVRHHILKDLFCKPNLNVQVAVENLLNYIQGDSEYIRRQSVLAIGIPE